MRHASQTTAKKRKYCPESSSIPKEKRRHPDYLNLAFKRGEASEAHSLALGCRIETREDAFTPIHRYFQREPQRRNKEGQHENAWDHGAARARKSKIVGRSGKKARDRPALMRAASAARTSVINCARFINHHLSTQVKGVNDGGGEFSQPPLRD
jgi:hypothetical protein